MSGHSGVLSWTDKSTNVRITHLYRWVPGVLVLFLVLGLGSVFPASAAGSEPRPTSYRAIKIALTVEPELRSLAHESIPARGTDVTRLRHLHEALLSREDAQSRESEFAFQFVGLAREAGVIAFFVTPNMPVDALPRDTQLAVGVFHKGRIVVFDAESIHRPAADDVHPIGDRAATALRLANRGNALLHAGETKRAVEQLEIAVRLEPKLVHAWCDLGAALRWEGERERALDAYETSLDLIVVGARRPTE